MGAAPRRVSLRRIAAIVFGILAVLALAFRLWVRSVEDRRWAAMKEQVNALQEEARTREFRRPVLYGDPAPGDAWDFYDQAFGRLANAGLFPLLNEFLGESSMADRIKVDAALAAHAGALVDLQRGARCGQARYPSHFGVTGFNFKQELSSDNSVPWAGSQRLMMLAACRARILREEGSPRKSAEILLDLCQFGRDLTDNGRLLGAIIGLAAEKMAFNGLHELLISGRLTRDGLRLIDQGLATLDEGWPSIYPVYLNEVAAYGNAFHSGEFEAFLQEIRTAKAVQLSGSTWRYAWSDPLMKVDAFSRTLDWARRVGSLDGKSWKQEREGWSGIRVELHQVQKKVGSLALVFTPLVNNDTFRLARERRAHLRLLRMAAHYLRTGEVLDLADPFGEKLLHSREGTRIRVWSVGIEGLNNGKGEWENPFDFVLEAGR